MEEKILQSFGLTKNESRIYLSLLKIGSAKAGEITEKSGIHRRNVYDSIERLMEKGLISFIIINNRKYFTAEHPERFLSIIEEKKSQLDEKKELLKQLMPRLEPLKNQVQNDVRFYKGGEGLKTVYQDILNTGKDYIGYGPGEELEKILRSYINHYIKKRIQLKIKARLIYGASSRNKPFIKNKLLEARFLPEEYSSRAALRIYGDRVAIMLLSEEESIAIVIKNKGIADGYKKYFEVMWNAAER